MELFNNDPKEVSGGQYNLKMVMTSGDARLQYSTIDNEALTDIADSIQTATSTTTITLSTGTVNAVITGDATMFLNKVQRG